MAAMPGEEEEHGLHVARNLAVEGGEELQQIEEDVHAHGVDDDGGQGLDGVLAGIEAGQPAHQEEQEQQDGPGRSKRPRTGSARP